MAFIQKDLAKLQKRPIMVASTKVGFRLGISEL